MISPLNPDFSIEMRSLQTIENIIARQNYINS